MSFSEESSPRAMLMGSPVEESSTGRSFSGTCQSICGFRRFSALASRAAADVGAGAWAGAPGK